MSALDVTGYVCVPEGSCRCHGQAVISRSNSDSFRRVSSDTAAPLEQLAGS